MERRNPLMMMGGGFAKAVAAMLGNNRAIESGKEPSWEHIRWPGDHRGGTGAAQFKRAAKTRRNIRARRPK